MITPDKLAQDILRYKIIPMHEVGNGSYRQPCYTEVCRKAVSILASDGYVKVHPGSGAHEFVLELDHDFISRKTLLNAI